MLFLSNPKEKYLIAGLGNPGAKYEQTRHNAGFMFIDELVELIAKNGEHIGIEFINKERKLEAHIIQLKNLLLIKPTSYMNNSGRAVQKVAQFYKIAANNVALAYDDLDIGLGSYKISATKSPKVHNGVESVKQELGNYGLNIRLGVDSRQPDNRTPGLDYVLQKFSAEEQQIFYNTCQRAAAEIYFN